MDDEQEERQQYVDLRRTRNIIGRETLVDISKSCIVVAGRGFAIGGVLHAGLGLISGVTTLKLFKQY